MSLISDLYKVFLESNGVQTDTRALQHGELFFALKGDNFDGNKYALQAIKQGAIAAIVDDRTLQGESKCILVEEVLTCLQALAKHHRQQFTFPFLAITGSNGKTTTKELLATVLSKKYNVLATKGNLNNHIGVPLTLLNITNEHDFAIIEMGANHIGEIATYCQWALPNYALINNCGKAHLEGFGGIEGVRKGKGELYDFIKTHGGLIFRNADFDYLRSMSDGIEEQVTYGSFSGDIVGKIYEREPYLSIAITSNGKEQLIQTNLVGDYNAANVLGALTVGDYFTIPISEMSQAIASYFPTNNRSEHKKVDGINIILDAYNANPSSMRAAIESFGRLNQKRRIIMLGAMMELGIESATEHEEILTYAMTHDFTHIVAVGEAFKHAALAHNILYFENAEEAGLWFWKHIQTDEWVYIKGSRLTAMERIIERNE